MCDFEINEELRSGSEGKVFTLNDDINKVVKVYEDQTSVLDQILCIDIMSRIDSDYILKCYDVCLKDNRLNIVLKRYDGDMALFIADGEVNPSSLDSKIDIFTQLLNSLYVLNYENNILHRDIKLENILFKKGEKIRYCLSDYGFSVLKTSLNSKLNYNTLNSTCKDPYYTTGEIDFSTDLYALGICFLEILTERINEISNNNLFIYKSSILIKKLHKFSGDERYIILLKLINRMTTSNKKERITLPSLLKEDIFKSSTLTKQKSIKIKQSLSSISLSQKLKEYIQKKLSNKGFSFNNLFLSLYFRLKEKNEKYTDDPLVFQVLHKIVSKMYYGIKDIYTTTKENNLLLDILEHLNGKILIYLFSDI